MATSGLIKYHIIGTLWVGQSSIVYRATDPSNRVVAIKMLLPETASSRTALRLMEREARYALNLKHPHIVEAIEFIRKAPMPALVMEHFSSFNLKMHIVRSAEFIREHARSIIIQAATAFGYVHNQGLVHRDVKPENILVDESGLTKIIDFALAEEIGGGWLAGLFGRKIAGTRPYIAPETIRRKAPDQRTDIYSLGITIYEMLTGRPPFRGDDRDELLRKHLSEQPVFMRTHNRNLTADIDNLVLQMLAKKPDSRPESMEDVIARVERIKVFAD
jgi:serine/threonine protein kinase